MQSISDKMTEIFKRFQKDLELLYGQELISIIAFGSVLTDEYNPGKSDINFMVTLTSDAIHRLNRVQPLLKKWRKQKIGTPLVVTKEYIHASLDSFPIEFFNLQQCYKVVSGEDVLADLSFKKEDIRLQCEHELKGKLLRLRQAFITTQGNKTRLAALISESIVTFTSIFKALLYLKNLDVPAEKKSAIIAACKAFDEIEEAFFIRLLDHKSGKQKISKNEIEATVTTYIRQIEKLSETIDKMQF